MARSEPTTGTVEVSRSAVSSSASSFTMLSGSSVVLKPSSATPLSALWLADLFREAGLPEGVLSVVTGPSSVGDHLVSHPEVDKISFTGSPGIAARIQAACAETLTPLVLELGGKRSARMESGEAANDLAAIEQRARELDVLADPDRLDLGEPEAREGLADSLPLRVEDARLEGDVDPDLHGPTPRLAAIRRRGSALVSGSNVRPVTTS